MEAAFIKAVHVQVSNLRSSLIKGHKVMVCASTLLPGHPTSPPSVSSLSSMPTSPPVLLLEPLGAAYGRPSLSS